MNDPNPTAAPRRQLLDQAQAIGGFDLVEDVTGLSGHMEGVTTLRVVGGGIVLLCPVRDALLEDISAALLAGILRQQLDGAREYLTTDKDDERL